MKKPFVERFLLSIGITISLVISLVPFLWLIVTSLKSQTTVEATPPTWWPDGSLDSYRSTLLDHQLFNFMTNSVIVAGATTTHCVALGHSGSLCIGSHSNERETSSF